LSKELGSGSFGSVRLGQHRASKVVVAIKIIKKALLEEAEVYKELMRNELQVLESVDHPNITRVFELMEDDRSFFVVMEYCAGGNLLDKVLKN
jgi:calcium-dependent protein kinase